MDAYQAVLNARNQVQARLTSANTAKVYTRHLNAFLVDMNLKNRSLADITANELNRWLQTYAHGASKRKQTIAALKWAVTEIGMPMPALNHARQAKKNDTKTENYIHPDLLNKLTRKNTDFFGSMYPERNRAMVLLTMATLASIEDLRYLQNHDVTQKSVIFNRRSLNRRDLGVPLKTRQIMHEYRAWRTNKYGLDAASAPFFRPNKRGASQYMTECSIYRIFRHVVEQMGYAGSRAGDGFTLFRISCARKMYIEGANLERLHLMLGLNPDRPQALAESLKITPQMELAREVALENISIYQTRPSQICIGIKTCTCLTPLS